MVGSNDKDNIVKHSHLNRELFLFLLSLFSFTLTFFQVRHARANSTDISFFSVLGKQDLIL
jgi:hypothetical protein